jgi:hypothetical protein
LYGGGATWGKNNTIITTRPVMKCVVPVGECYQYDTSDSVGPDILTQSITIRTYRLADRNEDSDLGLIECFILSQ